MQKCPYCSSALNRATHRVQSRTDGTPGKKSPGAEIVNCPDCGGVIDGFAAH